MDHQLEHRVLVVAEHARLEQPCRRSVEVRSARLREQFVAAVDVTVELPAQPEVQRQVRTNAEAVLRVKTESSESIALHAFGKWGVCLRFLIRIRGH